MDNCVLGAATRLAIEGQRLQFTKFIDQSVHTLVDSSRDAITGFRHGLSERTDYGIKIYRFRVMIEPTVADLTALLPVMGFTASGTLWTIQEDIPAADVLVDFGTRIRRYENAYCDMAVFRDQKGGVPLRLELGFVAIGNPTEDEDYDLSDHSSTFPAFANPIGAGYIFPQAAITLRGTARGFDRYALVINNNLQVRHQNSQYADSVCAGAGEIYLATSVPYVDTPIDNTDLYDEPMANTAAEGATLVYTRTSVGTTTVNMLKAHEIAKPPSINGKSEPINLPLFYRIMRTAQSAALTINHVVS